MIEDEGIGEKIEEGNRKMTVNGLCRKARFHVEIKEIGLMYVYVYTMEEYKHFISRARSEHYSTASLGNRGMS